MIGWFKHGGIHPPESKLSGEIAIEKLELPDVVAIPLTQHIGAPAKAIVSKGDKVLTGQLIAQADGFISANIHSPITGEVTAVDMQPNGQGVAHPTITIKREGDDVWAEGIDTTAKIVRKCTLKPQEIIEKIQAAGVVGMGGAGFPTHAKLTIPEGKSAKHLIINGAECEPYLTSDHRVMLEKSDALLYGVEILMRALGVQKAYIGIESNKSDAIKHLRKAATTHKGIVIKSLNTKYPQGAEKQLVDSILNMQIPEPPALPIDIGVVVCNVSTAVAVYEAVCKSKPLTERVVTITGKSLSKPKNLLVRIGTPISELIKAAGGVAENSAKVINGGAMMGRAMTNLDSPITKGCSGVTILSDKESTRKCEANCIKCARCVEACPLRLEPYYIYKVSKKHEFDRAELGGVANCCECGSCQYVCPANIPLLDYIRIGKGSVMKSIRERAMANQTKKR